MAERNNTPFTRRTITFLLIYLYSSDRIDRTNYLKPEVNCIEWLALMVLMEVLMGVFEIENTFSSSLDKRVGAGVFGVYI